MDPNDIEHRITPKTKAIMAVHYAGYPCDMDPIMEIAKHPSDDDPSLQVSVDKQCFSIPWFKHLDKEAIEAYAAGFRKVIENHEQLLEGDEKAEQSGRWIGTGDKLRR